MKNRRAQGCKTRLAMLTVLWASGTAWGQGVSVPTLPDHTARWWQWAISIPAAVHPLTPKDSDPTGADYCGVGQQGELWLLGGVFQSTDQANPLEVVRECRVPFGKTILLPVINAACDTASEREGSNPAPDDLPGKLRHLRRCAKGLADTIDKNTVSASFGRLDRDGNWAAKRVEVERVSTRLPFSVFYPPANIFAGGCGGPTPFLCAPRPNPSLSHADGYWAQVLPLLPGRYKFQTYGEAPAFDFALRVTYTLTVVSPHRQ